MTHRSSLEADLEAIFDSEKTRFDVLVECGGLDKGSDFIGANLRGIPLARARLKGFDFTNADLRDTTVRRAVLHASTVFDKAIIDVEDRLALQARGFLRRNKYEAPEAPEDDKETIETSSYLHRMEQYCLSILEKMEADVDNPDLIYQFSMAIASIGTYKVQLRLFEDAAYYFAESRRILNEDLNRLRPSPLVDGLITRLSNELERYREQRSR